MNRREKRAQDPEIRRRAEIRKLGVSGGFNPSAFPSLPQGGGGGGFGLPAISNPRQATGDKVKVNPFIIPKSSGLSVISQSFPSNYFVEWTLSSWRAACDQAQKMGYPISYAVLTQWAFECSPFIQSLFNELKIGFSKIPVQLINAKGDVLDDWNQEICEKLYFKDICTEVLFSNFWGFSGVNFEPFKNKTYKYEMQQIDPINRQLRESTFNFTDGLSFSDYDNLLFFQPSSSYERFLGWMQPITRMFISMNLNDNNWIQAGKRLAFPLITIGYPQADQQINKDGELINPAEQDARDLAENLDPSKALIYPYTLSPDGKEIIKAIVVGEEATSGGQGRRHTIFKDFNDDKQNEILRMIFLSTLTSTVGSRGSWALGTIHYKKYEASILNYVENAIAILNDTESGFIKKIASFYNNFPKDATLQIDKAKEWEIDDIVKIAPILQMSNKRFTGEFFEKVGLSPEYIEDAPASETSPLKDPPAASKDTEFEHSHLEVANEERKSYIPNFLKKKTQAYK
jgi:hypothetical protein